MSAIRLTIHKAAQELKIHRETLGKRLLASNIQPDEKGEYSLSEVVRAAFGDIESEKLRKTTEEADEIAMKNAKTRGELVEIEDFSGRLEKKAAAILQFIQDSSLSEDQKDSIANGIADIFSSKS